MDFRSSLFFLTFIILVKNIKCGIDFHFKFIQKLKSQQTCNETECQYLPKKWVLDSLMPVIAQKSDRPLCMSSSWELDSKKIPSSFYKEFAVRIYDNPEIYDHGVLTTQYGILWKHLGGCITQVNQLSDVPKYFSKTIELYDKYNMNEILRQGNITLGNSYTYQQISEAISKVTGKKSILKCLENTSKMTIELDQIILFIDKSLNFIDPQKSNYYGKCPSTLPILYKNYSSQEDLSARLDAYEGPQ